MESEPHHQELCLRVHPGWVYTDIEAAADDRFASFLIDEVPLHFQIDVIPQIYAHRERRIEEVIRRIAMRRFHSSTKRKWYAPTSNIFVSL